MRPTVGQILSGLALGAVAASMLVMPERFLGADDATVPGLMLQAPAERSVVQAAPIRARRVQVHRSAPIKRSVAVVAHRAPFTVSISRQIPVRPRTAPAPPPARKVVVPKPPVAADPLPAPPPPPPPAEPAAPAEPVLSTPPVAVVAARA